MKERNHGALAAALGAKAYTPAVQQQGGFYRDTEMAN